MFPLKWFCFIFVCSFEISPRECKCQEKMFKHVEGFCNSTVILSTHHVNSLVDCGQIGFKWGTCVGLKYRPGRDNLPNCEILKKMENCSKSAPTSSGNGDWKFYKALHEQTSPCFNNSSCKNGGTCVENPQNEGGFECLCKEHFSGKYCETVTGNFSSCKSLHEIGRDVPNGSYSILDQGGTKATKMYCQMTSLEGCEGGGWTMTMKIDGGQNLFNYFSTYWTGRDGYRVDDGRFGFDDVQAKMPSFWSTSFSEICIGMKVGNDLRFLTIPYAAESLLSLFSDGQFRATNVGREKWKSLIANSSLQFACDKEGFNIYHPDTYHPITRVGIIGDDGANCIGPDSFLGLGGRYSIVGSVCYPGYSTFPVSGNLAACSGDNGDVNINAMGYILVR